MASKIDFEYRIKKDREALDEFKNNPFVIHIRDKIFKIKKNELVDRINGIRYTNTANKNKLILLAVYGNVSIDIDIDGSPLLIDMYTVHKHNYFYFLSFSVQSESTYCIENADILFCAERV